MTFDEVREIAAARFEVIESRPRWIRVRQRGGPDVDQRIALDHIALVGRPWLALWADICASDRIHPRRALVHNATIVVGSVALEDDHYFIRHAVTLATLTPDDLVFLVDLLAHEARRVRAMVTTGDDPATVLRLYAE